MFRLLDQYADFAASKNGLNQTIRSFQPRFDVKEEGDQYVLQGEFPGIEQKNINIEFTDANTLSIKGRVERHHEEGTRPSAQVEAPIEQSAIAESETSSYHKASVEDESEPTMSGGNPDATPAETPAESVAETETQQAAEAPTPKSQYWLSERSVGEFSRVFTFPSRIDQESVKASLKDGILSVVVPKAQIQANKRIEIE
jgi:HSP20 family protein